LAGMLSVTLRDLLKGYGGNCHQSKGTQVPINNRTVFCMLNDNSPVNTSELAKMMRAAAPPSTPINAKATASSSATGLLLQKFKANDSETV
jgi:hypothetical protein